VGGMGYITTSNRDAYFFERRRSWSWNTTIVHQGCHSSSSLGSQAYGGRAAHPFKPVVSVGRPLGAARMPAYGR
jgi:hypothetical protein